MRLILLVFASLFFTLQTNAQVFISEIHYDNDGGDVNEGVEVTGPAGTDIAGYQIVPYNGSGGTSYSIYTFPAPSVFANQDNGFGAIAVLIAGLQNGAPDGVALVDAMGTVLQFLSYEGSFTATNGPASGLTSTDISVSETNTTPVGFSLGYNGTWNAPAASTFGTVNPGLASFLPVSLTHLTAHPMPKTTMVKWTTAQESGNDFFAVERSLDGRAFTEIGRVRGAGNSTAATSYEFTDEAPVAGTTYYRLRQVDFSGAQAVFGPVPVVRTGEGISAFPNPASDFIAVRGAAAGAQLTILDLNGRVISQSANTGNDVDVRNLRPGTYLVRISDANTVETLRFVRQ